MKLILKHLLVSGDGKLSLPRRSECIRYIKIASEVIVYPITFTNGNYLLTMIMVTFKENTIPKNFEKNQPKLISIAMFITNLKQYANIKLCRIIIM